MLEGQTLDGWEAFKHSPSRDICALAPQSNASAVSLRSPDLFIFLPTFLLTSSPDSGSPTYVDWAFLISPPLVLQPVAAAQRAISLHSTIGHIYIQLDMA